jgi:hypothetical protein
MFFDFYLQHQKNRLKRASLLAECTLSVYMKACLIFLQFRFREIFPPRQSPFARGHRQSELGKRWRRRRRRRQRSDENVAAETTENDQHAGSDERRGRRVVLWSFVVR